MNIKALQNTVTAKLGRQVLVAQKHSPVLLFAAGVVGVVTTVVLASRATLKLEEVLEEGQHLRAKVEVNVHPDYSEQDRKKDLTLVYAKTAINVAKLYAPAVVVGAVSIGALTGAHVILSRRNFALTAAYAALDKGFKIYRERVVSELGPEKDREFRYGVETREIVEETKTGPVVKEVKIAGPAGSSIYAKWFDETCPNWSPQPEYNRMFLKAQQNYANDLLLARGHVLLNDVYEMIGIKRTSAGCVVGWVLSKGGDNFIDFGIFDGTDYSVRDFVNGYRNTILLDFNVDGVVYDRISKEA